MLRSEDELRLRIAESRDAGERLDQVNYCGRLWLADYAANNDIIGDALEQMLDTRGEPIARRPRIWASGAAT